MPKRKLGADKPKEKSTTISVPKPELAEKRFERGVHDVAQALKKAKGHERQQQSKRISQEKSWTKKKLKKLEKEKGAKASDEETAGILSKMQRYQRQERVLKLLDLSLTARLHLAHTLLRIPALMEAESPLPQLLDTIAKNPPADSGHGSENDLHNVTSSLFNRPMVRESVSKAVTGMCLLLCVPIPERHQRPEWTKAERMAIHTGKLAPDPEILKKIQQMSDTEDEEDEEAMEEEPDTDAEEKALKQFAGRLADSSDEEDEEDDDDDDLESLRAKYKKALAEGPAEADSDSDSDSEMDDLDMDDDSDQVSLSGSEDEEEEEDDSESDSEDEPPRKRQAVDSSKGKTAADSRFLPTLMGGYISDGGDSSDGSRRSDEAAAERMLGQRKNRRGQRARQAIWEKKYKEEARHLKEESVNGKNAKGKGGKGSGTTWDAKRGAVDAGDGPRWLRRKMAREGKPTGRPARNGEPKAAGESKAKSAEPLHPSWEAAKKAKEKAQTATFAGKKIVFD